MTVVVAVYGAKLVAVERIPQINSTVNDERRKALYKSYQSEKKYKYDEAVKALTQIQKSYPQNYLLHLRIAWLYYMLGNYEYSKTSYHAALEISPSSVEAMLGCMMPLFALGKYSEVDELARKVISDDPGNYFANLRYAYSLRMQRKFEDADKVISRLRRMYPSDATVLAEAGMVKTAMNDSDSAKECFNEILNLNPDNKLAKDMLEKLSGNSNSKKNFFGLKRQ